MATVHHCSDWECNVLPLNVKSEFPELMKNPRISKNEKLGFLSLCKFRESVTVDKLVNALVVSDEPLKLVLIDTIGECTAELFDDSVETRFGGVGLPTAIKDANEGITNLSNLVTVQVHSRHTVVVSNLGVAHTPVSVVLDGDVHQTLNLTHGECSEVYVVDWRDCRSGDLSSISSTLKFAEQLVQHEVGAVVVFHEGAVSSTLKCLGEDGDLLSGESDGDHGRLR